MSKLIVHGGNRLEGTINIQGAKNSVLPILAATLLSDGVSELHNCPNLSDVSTSINILEQLGCECEYNNGTVTVNPKCADRFEIPESLMREMRSSVVFLGAVLGKFKQAVISSPGGCELGPRPIDLHLSALRDMGVVITEDHGFLYCNALNGLKGCDIDLSFPSVGATENIILAAVKAKGKTVIHNAAREPEICDLALFLNASGARVYGCGTDTVIIYGVERLCGAVHRIIPDRIVTATYLCAAAITGGKITVKNSCPSHIIPIISCLRQAGCDIRITKDILYLSAPRRLNSVPIVRTLVYPGFPTDAGPCMLAMLSCANGTSVFVENIFENRYRYVDELNRLGAKISIEGRVAVVNGVEKLSAANCSCTDLRGGAALVTGALQAEGITEIGEIKHILRGYEDICGNLAELGADIKIS